MVSVSNKNIAFQGRQQGRNKNSGFLNKNQKPASFGYAGGPLNTLVTGLEYLKQHPVAEVAFIDVTAQVAPRTAIDYNQNPVYGTETLFRELAPIVFNPFGPGIVAAMMMNRKGYKGITAGKDTILNLHEAWKTADGEGLHPQNTPKEEQADIFKKYIKTVLKNTTSTAQNRPFNELSEKNLDDIANKANELRFVKDKKAANKLHKEITEHFTQITGADSTLEVKLKPEHSFKTDIHSLIDDAISVGNKLVETLPEKREAIVKDIVNFSKKKTLWATGLSIGGIITLPYINNTITRLRTGCTGYTAYQDFGKKKDSSSGNTSEEKSKLWKAKAAGVGIIGAIMLTTMGAFSRKRGFFKTGGLKNFMDTIELRGKSAHLDLLKLIYGTSLISRVLFCRDEQEVKNTTLRDSCGFLNWLVLGGFVAKGVAHLADRKNGSFVNITGPIVNKDKNRFKAAFKTVGNWLSNVSLKTHSEMRAMNKNLPKAAGKKNMLIHTGAIMAGLGWSMFALGIGMPLLNNHMTNKARERQLQLKQKEKQFLSTTEINIHKASQPSFFSNAPIKNEKSLNDFIKQFKNS